jgi:hypothetical protein
MKDVSEAGGEWLGRHGRLWMVVVMRSWRRWAHGEGEAAVWMGDDGIVSEAGRGGAGFWWEVWILQLQARLF